MGVLGGAHHVAVTRAAVLDGQLSISNVKISAYDPQVLPTPKRLSNVSVQGHGSLRGRGFRASRWCSVVDRLQCTVRALSAHTLMRDRSTSAPSGLRPAFGAGTQIRLWPPLSIGIRFRSSRASASTRRSCGRLRPTPCGTRAARPGGRPNSSAARSV